MDPLDFLRALYESAPAGAGVVEFRALKNAGGFDARLFTDDPVHARGFVDRYRATSDAGAYYGVAMRKPGSTTGKKTDISVITALWADVDVVKMGWDMDRTLGMVKAHELRPSAIVNSGNGLHLYWVLDEALELDHGPFWGVPDDGIAVAEDIMKLLAEVFGGDNTTDVTRVLRVPGSWNTKDPSKPKQVKVLAADWREYRLEELAHLAQSTDKLIDAAGWIDRKQMKERARLAREAAIAEGHANVFTGMAGLNGRKLSWNQIWEVTQYKGVQRGAAYIGLDEAILRGTARAYADMPMLTDDEIVDKVLKKVQEIKATQAPNENWDWAAERREIADKLARFKPRWAAIVDEYGKPKKRKTK